jgi:protein TonB
MSKKFARRGVRQTFYSAHLHFKMLTMRILLALVFSFFCLFALSQNPVEENQVAPLDSIQELAWEKPKSDTVFEISDLQKPPVFPGGEKELLKFLAENLRWPKDCGDMNITGAIAVQFVIDTFGQVVDLKILKTPGKCFEPMVTEIFAKMPCWEPGEWLGVRVRTRMILPIRIHWE